MNNLFLGLVCHADGKAFSQHHAIYIYEVLSVDRQHKIGSQGRDILISVTVSESVESVWEGNRVTYRVAMYI